MKVEVYLLLELTQAIFSENVPTRDIAVEIKGATKPEIWYKETSIPCIAIPLKWDIISVRHTGHTGAETLRIVVSDNNA